MGTDKALIEVGGRRMAVRVADALRAGGCDEVLAVGGDAPALAALGLQPEPDRWPGEGPLGGLATALTVAPLGSLLVLAPCDLVSPSASAVRRMLDALRAAPAGVAVVVPRTARGPEWIHSAWRVRPELRTSIAALVADGSRRLDVVGAVVVSVTLAGLPEASLVDADTPDDLSGVGGAPPDADG